MAALASIVTSPERSQSLDRVPARLLGTHVNLLGWDNGVGLSRDLRLLGEVLGDAGCRVSMTLFERSRSQSFGRSQYMRVRRVLHWMQNKVPSPRFDLNIMVEHLRPAYLGLAKRNVFIPNPEWFPRRKVGLLDQVDTVLCKTRHAQSIFDGLGCETALIGFTNAERLRALVPRERAFFHLGGRSRMKGTQRLIALWEKHPEWPRLTVVQHPHIAQTRSTAPNVRHIVGYIGEDELIQMQNSHLFHLCPSETEGFGHYLCEALCVGAVTLTLDAAPMNEFVTRDRGVLIDHCGTGEQGLATTYYFDEAAMERAVARTIAMGDREIDAISANARAWYRANDHRFRATLPAIVAEACRL
jgi:hypothetical protein